MGIQKDAGELLKVIYVKYIEHKDPYFWFKLDAEGLEGELKWELDRIKRTILFLDDLKLIKLDETSTILIGMYPEGIITIENPDKFQKSFGFGINLGIVKADWAVKEKKK